MGDVRAGCSLVRVTVVRVYQFDLIALLLVILHPSKSKRRDE